MRQVPDRWALPRVVNRLHRGVTAPIGFKRRGNRCTREDSGLRREMQAANRTKIRASLYPSCAENPGPGFFADQTGCDVGRQGLEP